MQPGTASRVLPEVERAIRHLSSFHPVHALYKGLSESRASSSWVSRQGTGVIPPQPALAWVVEKRAAAPGKVIVPVRQQLGETLGWKMGGRAPECTTLVSAEGGLTEWDGECRAVPCCAVPAGRVPCCRVSQWKRVHQPAWGSSSVCIDKAVFCVGSANLGLQPLLWLQPKAATFLLVLHQLSGRNPSQLIWQVLPDSGGGGTKPGHSPSPAVLPGS